MITLNEGSWVDIDTSKGPIRVLVKHCDPIDGFRLQEKLDGFSPVILDSMAKGVENLKADKPQFEGVDMSVVADAFSEMCLLLSDWVEEVDGVELRDLKGCPVTWRNMSDAQKLKVIRMLPHAFMGLISNIAGVEEDVDLGKSEAPPTQVLQIAPSGG